MTEQIPQPQPLPEHWAIAIAQMNDGTKPSSSRSPAPPASKSHSSRH